MSRIFYILIICIMGVAIFGYLDREHDRFVETGSISVLVVESPHLDAIGREIHEGYMSIFEEEGVPVEAIEPLSLLLLEPKKTAKLHPAIVFPDENCQSLPTDLMYWVHSYLDAGGNALIVYDPGINDSKNRYISPPMFAGLTGVNYSLYPQLGKSAYAIGSIRFTTPEAADFMLVPPGKVWNNLTVGSYKRERLEYPVAIVEKTDSLSENEILAVAEIDEVRSVPAIVFKKSGNGKVMYVNLPLGYLKARGSDDLLPRSILRTFLFDVSRVPHVASTPGGVGGIIINWHIDNFEERPNIPFFINEGFLRTDLPASIHVTAGEFVNQPGDLMGFDACGKGRDQVVEAMKYGTIGSHGGWRHNWYASAVDSGRFGRDEMTYYIKKNNDCLQSITGYPILEYSAPDGVHPQPVATKVIEDLGMKTYYYAGDSGSAPNRTFMDGKMVSKKVVAIPVMPIGTQASIQEMALAGVTPQELEHWLLLTAEFAASKRTVRMFYSHLYDFKNNPMYIAPFKRFLDRIAAMQSEGIMLVRPMGYFAEYLQKVVSTRAIFTPVKRGLAVQLNNAAGLRGLSVAIPKGRLGKPSGGWFKVDEKDGWYYLLVTGDTNESSVVFPYGD